jgi:hypothetical protein
MPAPEKPAMQSGPGSLSQRTDGGPASKQAIRYASGMPYGEGQDFMDLQSQAAMEKATPVRPLSPGTIRSAAQQAQPGQSDVVPLNTPSQMPDQPVTHGADAGPGLDSSSLGLDNGATVQDQAFKQQIASYMPALMFIASRPGTSPETRNVIRQLRENM